MRNFPTLFFTLLLCCCINSNEVYAQISGLTCPADIVDPISCADATETAVAVPEGITTTCDPSTITASMTFDGDPCSGNIIRTYTYADQCGNSEVCMQSVNVIPPEGDFSITCPDDLTLVCGDAVPEVDTEAVVGVNNCGELQISTSDEGTVEAGCGTITRTFTATDQCGRTASCTQTIIFGGETGPIFVCPEDIITVNCGDDTSTNGIAGPTLEELICELEGVVFEDVVVTEGLECPIVEQITRSWTATDLCGRVGICIQNIEVVDETAPVLVCPTEKALEEVVVSCDDL